MSEKKALLGCFYMPKGLTITGRSSTIRNVFAAAVVPKTRPTAEEIREVLGILGMSAADLRCSYCGDVATEWDHMRPLVVAGRPTGYPSSIRNLVPSCGKCNQSKGNKDWKAWMKSDAPRSPTSRGVEDLCDRVRRLEAYERWANCRPLDVQDLGDKELWDEYYGLQSDILSKMAQAQLLSQKLARQVLQRSAGQQ